MRSSISACFFVLVERYEPQAAEKFFGAAVLGEQPTFAEQMKLDSDGFSKNRKFWLRAAGNQKFFDPTIFQKCWRGSGRVALIAARRQRNPRAMLLAHGGGGEKSNRFSRRGEQDRPAL